MYNFFVADEAPVPQWAHTKPKDPELVQALVAAYFENSYDLRSILRVLFNSDSFKNARFAKVKSPAEVVVGTMRLVRGYDLPGPDFIDDVLQCRYMGQDLLNPPTVEGWHTGAEWIDSGALVERINFVSARFGDITRPGVQCMIDRLGERQVTLSPETFVNACLEQLGAIAVAEETWKLLVDHASRGGPIRSDLPEFDHRVAQTLGLISATKEYQFA